MFVRFSVPTLPRCALRALEEVPRELLARPGVAHDDAAHIESGQQAVVFVDAFGDVRLPEESFVGALVTVGAGGVGAHAFAWTGADGFSVAEAAPPIPQGQEKPC